MATNARLGLDIVAFDKSRAAFMSVNRQLTGMTSNVNSTLRGIRQFRGAFTAAFAGLGVKAAIDSIGRAVDKNLVAGADKMQSEWQTAWDSWGNTSDKLITESAMGLDGLITDAMILLGLVGKVPEQLPQTSGKGVGQTGS